MKSQPVKIILVSKKKQKRRTLHLVTKTKEKSFMFASTNCRQWVSKYGLPITFHVSYGTRQTRQGKLEEFTNTMTCATQNDFVWALQAFVKEYYE